MPAEFIGTPLYVTASDAPVSGLSPTATPTVSSRFEPVVVTVWVQLNADPFAAETPPEPGPTASNATDDKGGAVTVYGSALPARPFTVTTTFPVVAPDG